MKILDGLKKYTQKELDRILEKHKKWLNDEKLGERADLSGADLRGADLSGADLFRADLSGADLFRANLFRADLSGANLFRADLSGADLSEANLFRANLSGANLSGANLSGANLSGADLSGADLRGADLSEANLFRADLSEANLFRANLFRADLSGANLFRADLSGADLSGANLSGANLSEANLSGATNVPFIPMTCPEVGSYTAFKKCGKHIVVLTIPKDALRSSATSRKCRANKAKVVRIENLDGSLADLKEIRSDYDHDFIYTVGKTVKVDNFVPNRWAECAPGIHHFINRQEAVKY